MYTNKTLLTALTFGLMAIGATNTARAQNSIQDSDNDTRVETARGGDTDRIYFRAGGVDRWQMLGSRLEPLNTGNSIFIGVNAGSSDNLTNNLNTFIGVNSGSSSVNGSSNTAIGFNALRLSENNSNNTALGPSALFSLGAGSTNNSNTAIGPRTLIDLTSGASNTAIGTDAGGDLINGFFNTFIGPAAGRQNQTGSGNVMIGQAAGRSNISGSGNLFLGSEAGRNETGSNKLYIANSATADPLIGGDFAAEEATINGMLTIDVPAGPTRKVQIITDELLPANDLMELEVPAGTGDDAAFIEMERGTDVEAQIRTDGTFSSNGKLFLHPSTFAPGAHQAQIESNGSSSAVQLALTESGAGDFARLQFNTVAGGGDLWHIAGRSDGSDPEMNFFYNDGAGNLGNIMSIDGDDAEVGIGTTDPSAQLHIKDVGSASVNEVLRLEGNSPFMSFYEGNDYLGYMFHQGPNSNLIVQNNESGYVSLDGKMFVLNNGYVGVGDASPEATFEVAELGNSASNPTMKLTETGTATTNPVRLQFSHNATNYFAIAARPDEPTATMNFNYFNGTTVESAITFDGTNKRIGINNEFPDEDLHIGTGTGATIKFGSVETLGDGGSNTIETNATFRPTSNGFRDLGSSSLQWRNAYLTGSVLFAPPSGGSTNARGGAGFEYGLDEVLGLEPAMYDVNGQTKLSIAPNSMANSISELYVAEELVAVEGEKGEAPSFKSTPLDNPAVNTIDLIPVLVKAIQEQNEEVADLREENAELQEQLENLATYGSAGIELEQMLTDLEATKRDIEQLKADLMLCCTNASGGGVGSVPSSPVGEFTISPAQLDVPQLEQNAPNPFKEATQIRYYLPEGMIGELIITDNFGREIGRYDAQTGANVVTLEGGQLSSGSYQYSLVVDGQALDTKQMVITH